MWGLWPPVPLVDEVHHVVHVDGIHLHRDAVVLIAVAGGHVIGWHVAKSEKAAAWQCLMARIAPPDVLVCDGGGGVLKAAKATWPDTRIQRCLFVFCQVGVGRFGVSFSPCERRVSGRFGVGRSCWLLVIALVIA